MVALSVGALTGRFRVVQPQLGQLFPVEVVGGQCGTLVVSSAHHEAGAQAVEVGDAGQVALRAVAIAVASPRSHTSARRVIGDGGYFGSGLAVEDREVFCAGDDHASRVAEVEVFGVVAHEHGFPVAVEVIDHELGIVGPCADIPTQVDAPQLRAVHFVAIEIYLAGVAVEGIIARIGGIPFHDDFIFSITVDITRAAIVGGVRIKLSVGIIFFIATIGHGIRWCDTRGRTLQFYFFIESVPYAGFFRCVGLTAIIDSLYDIGR